MCHNCQAGEVERNSGNMCRKGRNSNGEVSTVCKVKNIKHFEVLIYSKITLYLKELYFSHVSLVAECCSHRPSETHIPNLQATYPKMMIHWPNE